MDFLSQSEKCFLKFKISLKVKKEGLADAEAFFLVDNTELK